MMDLERVVKRVKEGALIDVVFLSDEGREAVGLGDHPCADARARGERFAYFLAFGKCAHALEVDRLEEEGDELSLRGRVGEMKLRLRVSPVWTDEQREILRAWAKEKDAGYVGRELRRVLS